MTKYSPLDLLKFSCFLIFIGSGIHHLTGNQPYRFVFEHSEFMRIVSGALLIIFGQLILLPTKQLRESRATFFIIIPVLILFIHSITSFVQAGFVIEQIVEHSLKIFLPLVLLRELRSKEPESTKMLIGIKVLIALTFIGHGLFAIGIHYVPNSFREMTTQILGVNVDQSYHFLYVMGILDFIFAVLIFTKGITQRVALYYLIAWGLITAFARPMYGILTYTGNIEQLVNSISGMIYRLPHGLIPLLVFATRHTKSNRITHIFPRIQSKRKQKTAITTS